MSESQKMTAIVTGASQGIGSAIATRLASDGFNVIVNYNGSEDAAQSVVTEIEKSGGTAIAIKADVSKPADANLLFENAEKNFGAVDILINNAGIMKLSPLADTTDETLDAHIAVNFKGTFNTLREAGRRLRDNGSIVNLSSTVINLKLENYSAYAATKAAVETMTEIFAKELRGRNITVNAVAPGPTATSLFLDGKPEEVIQRMSKMAPLERLGQPEDIANVVSSLVSADNRWVNGQVVRANGGIV